MHDKIIGQTIGKRHHAFAAEKVGVEIKGTSLKQVVYTGVMFLAISSWFLFLFIVLLFFLFNLTCLLNCFALLKLCASSSPTTEIVPRIETVLLVLGRCLYQSHILPFDITMECIHWSIANAI